MTGGRRTPVVVVGAGIAGLACARELADGGVPVLIREREPLPGGRLASELFGGRPVDTGAAYLTVGDPGFAELVERWRRAGLAREWTDTLVAHGRQGRRPAPGPMRWAAPGGLRSLAEDLAAGLPVELGRPVERVGPGPTVDGAAAAAVVLAMPGPQAAAVLDPALALAARVVRAERWLPVLAVALRFPRRCWADFSGAFVNDHPVLGGLFDDGERRGDGAPVLVAHTTAAFARDRLADPSAAGALVERAVRELLDLADPAAERYVRPWPHARPDPDPVDPAGSGRPGHARPDPDPVDPAGSGRPGHARPDPDPVGSAPFHLDEDGIGLAGDRYGTPRVQTAWCSGRALGRALVARLAATG